MMNSNEQIALLKESLRENPFFRSLSEDGLTFLASRAKQRKYEAGVIIISEGEPSKGLFWLQSGVLKAVKYSKSGREQILHLIDPGQTFNEVGSFSNLNNPVSVEALTAAKVWNIPGEAIRTQIQHDPLFAQLIIDVLSQRLRHSVSLVEDLSMRPVIGRLARLILGEAEGDTLFRPAWYTQDELAARLGTVTDVVQRSLRNLENEGIIKVERQQIRIIERDHLEKLAG